MGATKTIKRSTLHELTQLTRERAEHPELSGHLFRDAVSVGMELTRQANGNDSDIMEFAELVNAIIGRFGLKPDCTDDELEELFRRLGFEIDESEDGKYFDGEAFLERMKKTDRYFAMKNDIENFPSVDIDRPTKSQFKRMAAQMDYVPVEHGRWEYIPQTLNTLSQLRCPFCGWWSLDPSIDGAYNYCPNCGARMME